MENRKTFHDGAWHVFTERGEIKERCPPPTQSERARWAAEDAEAGNRAPFTAPKVFTDGRWWRRATATTNPDLVSRIDGELVINGKCDPPSEAEKEEWKKKESGGATVFPAFTDAPPLGTRIYKVITQRDEYFGGQFNPAALTKLMNAHALEGWRVVAITTADVSTFMGSFWGGRDARDELIVFLEKTVGMA